MSSKVDNISKCQCWNWCFAQGDAQKFSDDDLVELGGISRNINAAGQISHDDLCSRNYASICLYQKQLGAKDYDEALRTANSIKNQGVQDIALKRIALWMAYDKMELGALSNALKIFDPGYRQSVINNILSIAKNFNKGTRLAVESLMFSAIMSDNEFLVVRIAENISGFIADEEKKNEFLLTCVGQMRQQRKYKMAVSILNCISPGEICLKVLMMKRNIEKELLL